MTLNFVRENLTHNLLIPIHSHVLLTMEMHSEKCVSRQCHHGVNIVGYTTIVYVVSHYLKHCYLI